MKKQVLVYVLLQMAFHSIFDRKDGWGGVQRRGERGLGEGFEGFEDDGKESGL